MYRMHVLRFLLAFIGLLIMPDTASAAAGADALADFVAGTVIRNALLAFWGIAAAFLTFYAARLILEAQKEQVLTDTRQSFVYAFFGFVTISLGAAFADALFTPGFSGNVTDVRPTQIIPGINSVADFIITGASGVFVLVITIVGLRMITTQGEQGEFDRWRKVLIGNIAGVILMMVAQVLINAIAGADAQAIGVEIVGLSLFILTIFGFISAVALIVAGIMLIVSVDESLKDRAKKTIFGTLISLAIVLILVALINAFVFSAGS